MGFLCNCFYLHITFWSSKKSADKKGPCIIFFICDFDNAHMPIAYWFWYLIALKIPISCYFSNRFLKRKWFNFSATHFCAISKIAMMQLNVALTTKCFDHWRVKRASYFAFEIEWSVCPTIFPIRSTLQVTYLFCNIGKRIAKIGNSDIGIWGILFPWYFCNNLDEFLEKRKIPIGKVCR